MNKIKLALSAAVLALTGLASASSVSAAPATDAAPAKSDSQTGALKVSRLTPNAAEFRAMPSN